MGHIGQGSIRKTAQQSKGTYFSLYFIVLQIQRRRWHSFLLLPPTMAGEVMFSVPSVRCAQGYEQYRGNPHREVPHDGAS